MADSLRRIKDFLILGNYLRHCEIKTQFQFGQNGLKLRENLLRNHQKSLASTNSQNYLIHSNSPCVNSDILNEQLSCPEKTKLFYAWKEQAAEEPLSFFHLPLTDKTSVFETLKAENFGATSFTFLSSFNDRWNFSFQDFLRSRRQFWKRLFFDPGTNLHAAENDSTGTKPSAIIEATFSDFEDFSSNLTVESIRLLDKSEIPKVFEKEAGSVRMVESKTYLSSGTLAILLGSVRKRLYLPTTRLALQASIAPYQVTIGAADGEYSSNDVQHFVRYLHLLLQEKGVQVRMPDKNLPIDQLYRFADELGIPFVVVVPPSAVVNGVVKIRDRETAWFEQIHASHLTQRMVKNFQDRTVQDTWTEILERKKLFEKVSENIETAKKEVKPKKSKKLCPKNSIDMVGPIL